MALTYRTAGESHGPALVAVVEGVPAGLKLVPDDVDLDLARRQLGYGRGGRMKIERDRVVVKSGLRHGRTLGSPLTLEVPNKDFVNWERDRMALWLPVCMGAGVAVYFALAREPSDWLAAVICGLAASGAWLAPAGSARRGALAGLAA